MIGSGVQNMHESRPPNSGIDLPLTFNLGKKVLDIWAFVEELGRRKGPYSIHGNCLLVPTF
jgi:hypothetical protein